MAGYHFVVGLSAVDSFENAAMILSGMGPHWQPQTTWGKIFAGFYAHYSGLAVIAGVTFAPVIHRFLHVLYADKADHRNRQLSLVSRFVNRRPAGALNV